MSTLNVSNITDGTDTVGTSYVLNGSAKAWVNLNGTGTLTVNESFNITSVTDVGTGTYNLNLSNSMSSGNYSTSGGASNTSSNNWFMNNASSFHSSNIARFYSAYTAAAVDSSIFTANIHGDLA